MNSVVKFSDVMTTFDYLVLTLYLQSSFCNREGKVQSTLERELNVPETVVMQAYGTCAWLRDGKCLSSVLRVVAEWLPLGSVPVEHPPFISWQLSTRVCARSNAYRR